MKPERLLKTLESAWSWRVERGLLSPDLSSAQALRVFHGRGEAAECESELGAVAIDLFGREFWVTAWEETPEVLRVIAEFLSEKGAASAVVIQRPKGSLPAEPQVLFGEPSSQGQAVAEGSARFWVRMQGSRHPGLFLDHAPLRAWLVARSRGWKVLNTFAYTGSLSVAAGVGGAESVTTLDLSKPSIEWASENWKLNGLASEKARLIAGDVFEWLPRLKKEGKRFDCVISDPPSFSRGKKGNFSTSKDLPRLHGLLMDLLEPEGILVTSINSADVSWKQLETDVLSAARERKLGFEVLAKIDLPETFPTRLGIEKDRYLKGWILRSRSAGSPRESVPPAPASFRQPDGRKRFGGSGARGGGNR